MANRWGKRVRTFAVVAAVLAIPVLVLYLLMNLRALLDAYRCIFEGKGRRPEGGGGRSEGEGSSFAWNLIESRNFDASGRTLMKHGLIFVTCDKDEGMANWYAEEAMRSAHTYKKKNPSLHMSLITSAKNVTLSKNSVDMVLPLPSDFILDERQWTTQWTTKILALVLSPYAITLIAAPQTFCCGPIAPLFHEFEARGFDLAVLNHGCPLDDCPDTGVFMFRKSSGFMYLVNAWIYHQMIVGWDKNEQYALHCAMMSALNSRVAKLGHIHPRAGVRWLPAVGEPWPWGPPRLHHHTLLVTEPVLMTINLGDVSVGDHVCEFVNRDAPRPRAFAFSHDGVFWPTTPEQVDSSFHVVFDQESCNIKANATCHELPWASPSANFFEEILSLKPL